LRDRDEVKIAGVEGNSAANGTFFVKVKSTSVFSLYSDKKLKKPVAATGDYQFGGAAFRPFLEDYGIVVGINRYSEFSTLHGAEADAGRFAEWLRSPLGGMVAQDNVQVILSSDYEDPDPSDTSTWKPAETDLKTAFQRLGERAWKGKLDGKTSRVGRRLYIFLAGHGAIPARATSPNLDDAALLAANASLVRTGQHLLGCLWAEWFHDAAAFDEIFLFVDCCRDLKKNVDPEPCGLSPLLDDRRDDVSLFYALATRLDSKSWEQPFGSPPEYHGVFSYALMEALENETDGRGRLSGQQLKLYLVDRVPQLRGDQRPKIRYEASQDLTLIQRLHGWQKPNLRIVFNRSCFGKEVELFAGDNLSKPIGVHVATEDPWTLRVEHKLHKLAVPGDTPRLFELSANQEVTDVPFP